LLCWLSIKCAHTNSPH